MSVTARKRHVERSATLAKRLREGQVTCALITASGRNGYRARTVRRWSGVADTAPKVAAAWCTHPRCVLCLSVGQNVVEWLNFRAPALVAVAAPTTFGTASESRSFKSGANGSCKGDAAKAAVLRKVLLSLAL